MLRGEEKRVHNATEMIGTPGYCCIVVAGS